MSVDVKDFVFKLYRAGNNMEMRENLDALIEIVDALCHQLTSGERINHNALKNIADRAKRLRQTSLGEKP